MTRPVRPGEMDRAGFSLVELLVAIVISGVIMAAIYQVLVTNQRVSAVQREQVLSQQTVRAGLDLLAQELRELSARGGDLLTTEPQAVEFRAPRAFGIACEVNSPVLTVLTWARPFAVGDNVYVFADGDPDISQDDEWLEASVLSVSGGASCDGEGAQDVTVSGLGSEEWDRIRRGSVLRAWEVVEYGLDVVDGDTYLVRVRGGTSARLVGPLQPGDGLVFEYLDADGNVTGTAADVSRIRMELRTLSAAMDQAGRQVADTLATAVFLRN